MLACTNLIENHVRAKLRSDFDITLPRFDLMSQLERSPQGLKMGELSKRMMVTGGNVTGITDQLVREGLVVREDSPKDRRAYIVKLTAEGRRSFRRMAEAHEDWMVALFSGMDEKQRDELYDLLAELKSSAGKVAAKR
jgi:DNA-binding MarR family transcriptional regulator